MLTYFSFRIIYTCISEYITLKMHYMPIGNYMFVIFLDLFVIRNFRGTRSSIETLMGYMARESLRSPALAL